MASFDDYDEFGNYIGADLDSDDEDEIHQTDFGRAAQEQPDPAPLEGFDDERIHGQELMEIDGSRLILLLINYFQFFRLQNLFTTQWFCTRTSSITHQLETFMDQMWKHLYKRKMPNLSLNPSSPR